MNRNNITNMQAYALVCTSTWLMWNCLEVIEEGRAIHIEERDEWAEMAETITEHCRLLRREAEWNEFEVAARHISTMTAICEQYLLRLCEQEF